MTTSKRRCVIYARYSDIKQNPMSIRDQIAKCRELAGSQGWSVIQTYEDAAITGHTDRRTGFQQMWAGIEAGLVDFVVAESLDRLTRHQVDTPRLYEICTFNDVEIHTLSEGRIGEIHIGINGTMNALYIKELARKTRRGLEGRIRDGSSAGGKSFGYRVPVGNNGQKQVGRLEIVEEEAAVIRRIFRDFADGKSPLSIVTSLNEAGIASPSGKHWKQNTIYGNRQRGTGILNNELYVGTRVWNRLEYRKDPETRRRVSRLRPEEAWLREPVPDLRIIDDGLWQAVKARQATQSSMMNKTDKRGAGVRGLRRKKYLLSGLLRCGCCNGKMTVAGSSKSKAYYCANAKQTGGVACKGMPGLRLDRIEPHVFDGIREELMKPSAYSEFRTAFTSWTRARKKELTSDREIIAQQLHQTEREIVRLTKLLTTLAEKDLDSEELLSLLLKAEDRRKALREQRDAVTSDLPPFPEDLPALYQAKIDDLVATLSNPEIVHRANEQLAAIIDRIVIQWDADRGTHMVELVGDPVGLLGFSEPGIKKACALHRPSLTMVAGTGFEPVTFRL